MDQEPRVRNPEAALIKTLEQFFENPVEHGAKLARLGKQEGYELLSPYLPVMHERAADNQEAQAILVMLRQPEWVWRSCENDYNLRFFGFEDEGTFVPAGYYIVGRGETGEHRVLDVSGDIADNVVGASCKDPREEYEPRSVRYKIWRRGGAYWVVAVGRVVDLVKNGFDKKEVCLTEGRGYLKKVPAYADVSKLDTVEEAREKKAALTQA